MSDLICRKTLMRCQTPGMCSPHGGCQSQHDRDSSELRRLCAERDQLRTANQRLEGEVAMLKAAAQRADDVLSAIIRNNQPLETLAREYGGLDWHVQVGKIRTGLAVAIAALAGKGGDV